LSDGQYYEEQPPRYIGSNYREHFNVTLDPSIAKMQMDFTDTIARIKHNLKGEILYTSEDDRGRRVTEWRPTGMRMMNDEGVRFVISDLQMYLIPNTFLSIVTDYEINEIMRRYHQHLAGVLVDKQEEFEIENAYLYNITDKVTNTIWLALKRGTNSKTLDALTKSYKAVETHELAPRKKKLWIF